MKRHILISKPDGSNEMEVTEKAFETVYKEKGFVAAGEAFDVKDLSAPSNRRAVEFTSTDASGEVSAASIAKELGLSGNDGDTAAETDEILTFTEGAADTKARNQNTVKTAANAKSSKKTPSKKNRTVAQGKAAKAPEAKTAEVKNDESNAENKPADNGSASESNSNSAGSSGGDIGTGN